MMSAQHSSSGAAAESGNRRWCGLIPRTAEADRSNDGPGSHSACEVAASTLGLITGPPLVGPYKDTHSSPSGGNAATSSTQLSWSTSSTLSTRSSARFLKALKARLTASSSLVAGPMQSFWNVSWPSEDSITTL